MINIQTHIHAHDGGVRANGAFEGARTDAPATAHRAHGHRGTDGHRERDHSHHIDRSARDTRVFALEARRTLEAKFSFSSTAPLNTDDVADPAATASSLLTTARQIAAGSDQDRSTVIAEVRGEIRAAASSAKEIVGTGGDHAAIDAAAELVDRGLEEIAAQDTTSVTSVQAKLRQSYAMGIRTQEGDIVKISLRQRDSLNATQVSSEDANGSAQTTEVELRSSTKLKLRIEGDLSEAELAAIQDVFERAANIADAFFAGDLAAAVASSDQFEFDSTQLAQINMSMKSSFSASATYARSPAARVMADTTVPAPGADSATPLPAPTDAPTSPELATETPAEVAIPAADAAADAVVPQPNAEQAPPDPVTPAPTDTSGSAFQSLDEFVAALTSFFEALVNGLEDLQTKPDTPAATRYKYVTAFKTEALHMSLLAAAPAESTGTATQIADAVAEAAAPTDA